MNNFNLGENANIYFYEKLIPEHLTEGYILTNGLFTTYGLEPQILTRLLIGLECMPIVKEGVDVFHDVEHYRKQENEYSILPEESLHGVFLWAPGSRESGQKGTKFAFHPKVILLRYEKQDNCQVRYVLAVLSKNITASSMLDAFCVVYGDIQEVETLQAKTETVARQAGVTEEIAEIISEVVVEPEIGTEQIVKNGQRLAEWIEILYEKLDKDVAKERGERYKKELPRVTFRCVDEAVTALQFLTERDMKEELSQLEEIIMVSPFISDTLVKGERVKRVVSAGEEYGKLSEECWEKVKKKAYQFADELIEDNRTIDMVHAKLYCGKTKQGETRLIIGSSNATINGCAWFTGQNNSDINKVTNMEFNVALTLEKGADEEFWSSLEPFVVKLVQRENFVPGTLQNEERSIWGNFLDAIANLKTDSLGAKGWKIQMNLKASADFKSNYPGAVVQILENREAELSGDKNKLECECSEAKECLWIGIIYQNIKKKYCLRLAPYIEDETYLEELNRLHQEDYHQVVRQKINSLLQNVKRVSLPQKETSQEVKKTPQRKTADKRYIYEKLKELAIIVQREVMTEKSTALVESRYRERLEQLKKHVDLLQGEQEYESMSRAIDALLRTKGEV